MSLWSIFLIHFWHIYRGPHLSEDSSLPSILKSESVGKTNIPTPTTSARNDKEESEDESSRKKRKHDEKRHERREKRHSRDSDDKRKHKKHKEKRRHDSDWQSQDIQSKGARKERTNEGSIWREISYSNTFDGLCILEKEMGNWRYVSAWIPWQYHSA